MGDLRAAGPARTAAALFATYAVVGCSGGESASDAVEAGSPWFEEVAAASGLDFVHTRGRETRYHFPEITGSGLAFFDYDRDGDADLYCVQSGDVVDGPTEGVGNRLYENDGRGTFRDVTERAGVGDTGYGMGVATGDYDGDGHVDLYVTNLDANVLYRNDGDGTFTDVTEAAGVGHESWGTGCAFLDYDKDGDLDLFITNYVRWSIGRELDCVPGGTRDYCNPNNYDAPARDVLYRNEGDGTFTDVTEPSGIGEAYGNGLGVACGDFDLDGFLDVYVANDMRPNQLWMNQGDGTFVNRALLAGCAVNKNGKAEAGMGVSAEDVDQDGDLDLFMTHLRDQSNTLYLNDAGLFSDRTAKSGLGLASVKFTGFGMGFADFDHDGALDVYVANGRVNIRPPAFDEADVYAEPNQVFRGLGGGFFEELLPRGGTAEPLFENSRGMAFADVDRDGDIDVAVSDNNSGVRLLRNIAEKQGHWVSVRVLDGEGRDAIGARVRLTVDGKYVWRHVQTAYSYCSANDPAVHFGLGPAQQVEEIRVLWADGGSETFPGVELDGAYVLRRGEGG